MKLRNIKNKNKKGFVGDLLVLLVVAFALIIVFAVLWFFMVKFNGMMQEFKAPFDAAIPVNSANLTGTNIIDTTITPTYNAWNTAITYGSAAMLFGMIILTFVTAYYSKNHPLVIVVYFILTIIFVAISMIISNIYQDFIASVTDPDLLAGFTNQLYAHYFLLYLPWFTSVIGLFGLGLSIIASKRDGGQSGY